MRSEEARTIRGALFRRNSETMGYLVRWYQRGFWIIRAQGCDPAREYRRPRSRAVR